MFRGVSFLPYPVAESNLLDFFLSISLSLFLCEPASALCLADAVNDKNLGLHVNVDWPLLVFLRDLIPLP